jgi:hypothetical protein
VILLIHGYDKGRDDSARRQNKEIQEAQAAPGVADCPSKGGEAEALTRVVRMGFHPYTFVTRGIGRGQDIR